MTHFFYKWIGMLKKNMNSDRNILIHPETSSDQNIYPQIRPRRKFCIPVCSILSLFWKAIVCDAVLISWYPVYRGWSFSGLKISGSIVYSQTCLYWYLDSTFKKASSWFSLRFFNLSSELNFNTSANLTDRVIDEALEALNISHSRLVSRLFYICDGNTLSFFQLFGY